MKHDERAKNLAERIDQKLRIKVLYAWDAICNADESEKEYCKGFKDALEAFREEAENIAKDILKDEEIKA